MTLDEEETQVQIAAKAAHETNRIYCEAIGDPPQSTWEEAPEWQRIAQRMKDTLFHCVVWSVLGALAENTRTRVGSC